MRPLRVLFNAWADIKDVNAQNLNARDIACRLDVSRYQVSFFSSGEPDPRLLERLNTRLIRMPRRLGSITMLRHFLADYDVIFYTRISRADSIYRWMRKHGMSGTAVVSPVENQLDVIGKPGYPKKLRRYWDDLFGLSDAAVANSPYVAQTARQVYGVDIPVIFSGVDTGLFRRAGAGRVKRGKSRVKVLYAGTFQERKHPELVLQAARQWPDADFVLIGSGPLEGLLASIKENERLANVTFIRTKPYLEYADELASADIFLFPSRVEGMSKVTIEAAAAGIPAIIFDDYHSPTVLDGITGFMVGTFDEMTERLGRLIDDPELREKMGRAGADHALLFDWDVIVPQWDKVLEEVMRRKHGR